MVFMHKLSAANSWNNGKFKCANLTTILIHALWSRINHCGLKVYTHSYEMRHYSFGPADGCCWITQLAAQVARINRPQSIRDNFFWLRKVWTHAQTWRRQMPISVRYVIFEPVNEPRQRLDPSPVQWETWGTRQMVLV